MEATCSEEGIKVEVFEDPSEDSNSNDLFILQGYTNSAAN